MPENEVMWKQSRGGDFSRKSYLAGYRYRLSLEIFLEMYVDMARQTCVGISLLCQMRGAERDDEHTRHPALDF